MVPNRGIKAACLRRADVFLQRGVDGVLFGFVATDFLRLLNQPVVNCKIGWHGSPSHTSLHNLMCKQKLWQIEIRKNHRAPAGCRPVFQVWELRSGNKKRPPEVIGGL